MKRTAKKVTNGIRTRKYTVTSRDVLCDDGKTRSNVMLTSELAKPIGIVNANKPSMNKAPRISDKINHPCVVTRKDGSRYIIVKSPNRTTKRQPRNTVSIKPKNDFELMEKMTGPNMQHNFNA